MPRPMRTPRFFVLLSIVASCAASTGALRAAADCDAKPNAQAPPGQHWYYRTDRNFKAQCWYLAPQVVSVHKSAAQGLSVLQRATETMKQTASEGPAMPAAASVDTCTL